ncbi:MAG TPA: SMP-30/gluconolactonase/LRE family protein [Pyrinomonadaceae bacterium]|nr:SMP-30/gluconolactonase/LRE family protein [Pyrinomonadaceae bacterium]
MKQPTFKLFAFVALFALAFAGLPGVARTASAGNPHQRPLGDSRVFASVPTPPGFPEAIAVNGDRVYVSGPAQFGNFVQPSVLAYDLDTGALVAQYPIKGQNLNLPQAASGLAFGKGDVVYVADLQQGVIRFDVEDPDVEQDVYSPALPDLPTCASVAAGTPCSPTAIDRTPLPNELVFDKKGNLYLTDSFQATIWRIPPGGGPAEIWFQSPALDMDFGANGARVSPDGNLLYVATSINQFGMGAIYTLPLVDEPAATDLQLFHQYNPGDVPDSFAFGKSGKLYVALAGTSQISVLNPDGSEETRYSGPAQNPNDPSQPLPWVNPSAVAFNDKTGSLLVTNHAIFAPNPEPLFAVFDVFVDDKAEHLARPNIK